MAADLGVVKGVIELQDNFTSEIGLAQAALSNFSKENQESLKAVAGAAGIVTGAIAAIGAAALALGTRGSEIADVDSTLEHFAGSAENAKKIMDALRDGTKGTVDNFVLAKDAAHLLSAGVKLTADDFGTLGQAAFVLQNRGLGGTKEQLQLVSDALVTGRTRALAMAVGVVDTGNAEELYAKKLGITKDQLSLTGQAEAKRIAVMDILSHAVKDAGNQERDFGEQIEAARAKLSNWIDDLSKAVAKSPVLAAGMKAIGAAFDTTFGGDTQGSIKLVVGFIEDAAVVAINFGIAAVETARVFNVGWSAIKVAILGTEMIIATFADMALSAFAAVANGLASISGDEQVKAQAAAITAVRDQIRLMSNDLSKQTEEAMKGVVGQSEFDKTLDKVSGTLMNVKDAMVAASKATVDNTKVNDEAAAILARRVAFEHQVQQSLIDRQKIEDALWKIEAKSLEETTKLWDEYFSLRISHSGTTVDAQKAAIQAWFDDEVAKLDSSDKNWVNHYTALEAVAKEKLDAVGSDWDNLRDKSIEGMQQMANAALADYNKMMESGLHFTREVLDAQVQKFHTLQDAARGLGDTTVAAMQAAATATAKQNALLEKMKADADAAAAANRALGGSFTYDLTTTKGVEDYRAKNPSALISWSDEQIVAFAKKGGTLEDLINQGVIVQKGSANRTGFGDGGTVDIDVGEHGREVVRVPLGSTVLPNSMVGDGGGGAGQVVVHNKFFVNGTGAQVGKQAAAIIMTTVKQTQFLAGSR